MGNFRSAIPNATALAEVVERQRERDPSSVRGPEIHELEEMDKDDKFREFNVGYYYQDRHNQLDNGKTRERKENDDEKWVPMDKPRGPAHGMQTMNMRTGKYFLEKVSSIANGTDNAALVSSVKTFESTDIEQGNTPRKSIKAEQSIKGEPESIPPAPVELRGITLRQLRAILENIIRRCVQEKWVGEDGKPLTPDTVTLYDADKYIIRPFTEKRQESFVTCLPSTAGPQKPRLFVSHWWGESVMDFIRCIEQFVRDMGPNNGAEAQHEKKGGGMTDDTPLWICAYANNWWNLSDITSDPKDSGFYKAMVAAENRTITILDKKGVVFTRVWCIYELYLTLMDQCKRETEHEEEYDDTVDTFDRPQDNPLYDEQQGQLADEWMESSISEFIPEPIPEHIPKPMPELKQNEGDTKKGMWAVYTACPHTYIDPMPELAGEEPIPLQEQREAVGIISEGATADCDNPEIHAARESHFPYELILRSLSMKVEEAEALQEDDRKHILNAIIGKSGHKLNDAPPLTHEAFSKMNDVVKGNFVASESTLRAAMSKGEEEWMKTLVALSKGSTTVAMKLNFEKEGKWKDLKAHQAVQLVSHLPLALKQLSIKHARFGPELIETLIKRMNSFDDLKSLTVHNIKKLDGYTGGEDTGTRFAQALRCNDAIRELCLYDLDLLGPGNVMQWVDALLENKRLTKFFLSSTVEDEVVNMLVNKTEDFKPDLTIRVMRS